MPNENEDKTAGMVLLGQILGAVAGGSAAMLAIGDPHAVVASSATGQAALQAAAEHIIARRTAKAGRMIEYAADRIGRDARELVEAITDDDALLELLAVAIEAATHSIGEQKLRTIGGALASGVLADDDAQINLELQITRALADLEAPHVRVLDFMATAGFGHKLSRLGAGDLAPLSDAMDGLVAVLRSHGLIEQRMGDWTDELQRREEAVMRRTAGAASITAIFKNLPEDDLHVTTFGHLLLDRYRSEA